MDKLLKRDKKNKAIKLYKLQSEFLLKFKNQHINELHKKIVFILKNIILFVVVVV